MKPNIATLLLVLSMMVANKNASLVCPDTAKAEEGCNLSIQCNITRNDKAGIYLYKGNIPTSDPVLEFKNGVIGDMTHHQDVYDITRNGTLKINNVKREHEDSYFILVIYDNNQREARKIKVEVFDGTNPSDPETGPCPISEERSMMIKNRKSLTCKLSGLQPMLSIKWMIESSQDVNVTTKTQITEHDKKRDTWNVSITLLYTALSCDGRPTVSPLCDEEDILKLLKGSVTAEGHCSTGSLKGAQEKGQTLTYFCLWLFSFIITVALVCTVYTYLTERKNAQKAMEIKNSKTNGERKQTVKQGGPSSKGKKRKRLVSRKEFFSK